MHFDDMVWLSELWVELTRKNPDLLLDSSLCGQMIKVTQVCKCKPRKYQFPAQFASCVQQIFFFFTVFALSLYSGGEGRGSSNQWFGFKRSDKSFSIMRHISFMPSCLNLHHSLWLSLSLSPLFMLHRMDVKKERQRQREVSVSMFTL